MAKEIPFFKFFVGEWANGDITAENYKTQGVFINICSIYWTKEGELSEVFLRKKIKANKEISLLIDSEIIKVENKNIVISFLDEQLSECEDIRVKNSKAGKKSASQRAFNKRSTSVQPKLNEEPTESQPLREDKEKKREDKKREENLLKIDASQIKSFKDKILSEVEQKNIVSKAKAEVEKRGGKWVCDYDFNPYDVLGRQFTNWNRICVEGKYTFEDVNHIKNVFYKFVVEYWEFNYDTIIGKRKTKFKKQYTKK